MIQVEGLGNCEVIAVNEFDIVVVVEGESVPRYLDREDYPDLSVQCVYEKMLSDKIKHSAMDVSRDEYVYVNIFDSFATRQVSPSEIRTKMEDYLITFENMNGNTWIDDLNLEGNCTLVSKREKDGGFNFANVIASIELMYGDGSE